MNEYKMIGVSIQGQTAPRPILDLGVSTGFFASRVKAEIGLDPSMGMLSIAKMRGIDFLIVDCILFDASRKRL